jgi:hypothetical protein
MNFLDYFKFKPKKRKINKYKYKFYNKCSNCGEESTHEAFWDNHSECLPKYHNCEENTHGVSNIIKIEYLETIEEEEEIEYY